MFPCPCCGYLVFGEPPGSFDICPICDWEDDNVQLAFPDLAGGANGVSLIQAQQNFAAFGTSDSRTKSRVRSPRETDARDSDWRTLDPSRDHYLSWDCKQDLERWRLVKAPEPSCLYYWRPEYWLKDPSIGS